MQIRFMNSIVQPIHFQHLSPRQSSCTNGRKSQIDSGHKCKFLDDIDDIPMADDNCPRFVCL